MLYPAFQIAARGCFNLRQRRDLRIQRRHHKRQIPPSRSRIKHNQPRAIRNVLRQSSSSTRRHTGWWPQCRGLAHGEQGLHRDCKSQSHKTLNQASIIPIAIRVKVKTGSLPPETSQIAGNSGHHSLTIAIAAPAEPLNRNHLNSIATSRFSTVKAVLGSTVNRGR